MLTTKIKDMKRTILLILAVAGSIVNIIAQNYEEVYYEKLMDKNFQTADSVLRSWQSATPNDAELYPAKFNYFINKGFSSIIVVDTATTYEGEHFAFSELDGTPAGTVHSQVSWNDEDFENAIKIIEEGIAKYPRRLDMRLGELTALSMHDMYDRVADVLVSTIEEGSKDCNGWTRQHNEPVDSVDYSDVIFEKIVELYNASAYNALNKVCEKYLLVVPNDFRVINICAAVKIDMNDLDAGLALFKRALTLAPVDGILKSNIAYVYLLKGEKAKAKEIYQEIIDNPQSSDDSKEIASQALANFE